MIKNKKKQVFNEFILISACKGDEYDNARLLGLESDLIESNFVYKQVNGCYNGIEEVSFYVELDSNNDIHEQIDILDDLAYKYNQESILHVNKNREARLLYIDIPRVEHIGTFKQVPKCFALQHVAYTYDIDNNGYYVTTKTPIKE